MSHANTTYTSGNDSTVSRQHYDFIHEDDAEYGAPNGSDDDKGESLGELSQHISTLLSRAESLTWLLQSADSPSQEAVRVTTLVIGGLIQETREVNERLRKKVMDLKKP